MFRLFFLALMIYLVLRLVRRVVSMIAPGATQARSRTQAPPPSNGPMGPVGSSGVIDEMKRCPTCGTYNPTRLAYRKKDLYFCNARCHEDFNEGKPAS